MEDVKNKKNKYINEFPLIIMVVVAILVIVLVNIYLNFRPYKTIDKKGYAVLSQNMTYNLISNASITDSLNVGVVGVDSGDSIYKQVDTYYVGEKEKKEIDFDYPLYSTDGLTIYSLNDNFILIDRNFNKVSGYPGLSISSGILYNDGDTEPADDIDYILAYLNNSVFLGLQTITIKTQYNEYNIPINSPLYFNTKYINYYTFDGEKFIYSRINDIYYDSLIKIGDVSLTYEEFLLKLEVVKEVEEKEPDNENNEEVDNKIEEIEIKQDDDTDFIKPTVTIDEFKTNVYSINSTILINDPNGVITTNPTFEIYAPTGKLHSRKKISNSGDFTITGLLPSTEYNIIGTYKYKNKQGITMVVTFFEGKITTKDISQLEEINLSSDIGERYSNKIEIKDLTILNLDNEALKGVKKVVLNVWKDSDKKTSFNLSYSNISSLIKGKATTITTSNSLQSNTVYNYEIKFYDGDSNELKTTGKDHGKIQTTKEAPSIKFSSNIDKKTNDVDISIITSNKDDVYLDDYNYKLYSYSGLLISEGTLNYEDKFSNDLKFDNLDYNTNYKIIITGTYDLEDGRGQQELYEEKTFTTADLSSIINAWYDQENLIVTNNSISTQIYISPKTTILDKEDTEVIVYLKDKNGNDVLDDEGNLKCFKTYKSNEIEKNENGYFFIDSILEGLDSNTEYIITLKFLVKQIEKELSVEKELLPSITTLKEEAYIEVINKKLLGNILDLSFNVVDYDSLIDDSKIIIEIYEGKYETIEEIDKKYIYREVIKIDNKQENKKDNVTLIERIFEDYSADFYTIKISAKPYNGMDVENVIKVNSNQKETQLIIVDRNINAKTEMFQQKQPENSKKYLTEINIKYKLGETSANLYAIDCVNDSCKVLGYIDNNNNFQSTDNSIEYRRLNETNDTDDWYSGRLKFFNTIAEENHIFYLTLEKSGTNLIRNGKIVETISINNLEYLYKLDELEYTTEYELYNISTTDDLFDETLIKKNGETRHYVVTGDLNLKKENGEYLLNDSRFSNFGGSIDFQGYSLTLYKASNSSTILFPNIKNTASLKNAVLNYELEYTGTTENVFWVNYNYGTIENIIVHVNQKEETGRAKNIGVLAYRNCGIIKNFVVYLDSDIHTYSNSSLVTYENTKNVGIIKYGSVISLNNSKIYLHDTQANHGTFAFYNYGTIKNIYNLTDVISAENSRNPAIATVVYNSYQTGSVKNTLSVATTTVNSSLKGPNVYNTWGETSNNYYVDTKVDNFSYKNNYNKKISKSSLRNSGVLNVILNSSKLDEDDTKEPFSIISGYYPIINMSKFMTEYQEPIEITYDITDSTIDIISTEVINDNKENGIAKVKIYISNPNNLEITDIKVSDLTTSIEEDSYEYDENYQITSLILDMMIEKDTDKALSNYNIESLVYKTTLGDEISKSYPIDSNPRTIEITLYNRIETYEQLINSINKNDNIYFINDITLTDTTKINDKECLAYDKDHEISYIIDDCLPKNQTYSATIDGGERTLDLGNYNIKRGYFIYDLSGKLNNLQIKNQVIKSNSYYIGFIRVSNYAEINNIDIESSVILVDKRNINNTGYVYVGTLVARANNTKLNKISINNITIEKDSENGFLYYLELGGIIGSSVDSEINDSYVYNFNATATLDTTIGYQTIGGIIGYMRASSSGSNINNCYALGVIDTELSYIGGIAGTSVHGTITNSYSKVNILSSGNYIGGIVGNYSTYWPVDGGGIKYNLYLGTITNLKEKPNFDEITSYSYAKANNYNNINDFMNYQIDNFNQISIEKYPYLVNSSFVDQQVKNLDLSSSLDSDFEYKIEYNRDSTCEEKLDENLKNDEKYINACATSANLYTTKELSIIEGLNNDGDLIIKSSTSDNSNYDYMYEISPNNKYYNSYFIKYKNDNENLVEKKIYISFFKHIKDNNDWREFNFDVEKKEDNVINYKKRNDYENALLLSDIQIDPDGNIGSNLEYNGKSLIGVNRYDIYKKIDYFYGNNKTISMKSVNDSTTKDSIKYSLIYRLDGTMRDVTIENFKVSGKNSNYNAIVSFNSGIITNCKFDNINIVNYSNIVGVVGLSTGYINNVELNNIDVTGFYWVGSLVGYDTSEDRGNTHINNVTANNIKVKGYKNIGGLVGQVDYNVENVTVNNVTIEGFIGRAGYNGTLENEYKYIYPKDKIGGIIGYGDCIKNCTLSTTDDNLNKIMIGGSTNVGGIGGYRRYEYSHKNLNVKNLIITTDPKIKTSIGTTEPTTNQTITTVYDNSSASSSNIGGSYGFGIYIETNDIENVVIADTTPEILKDKLNKDTVDDSFTELTASDLKNSLDLKDSESIEKADIYKPLNSSNVGGVVGYGYSSSQSYVKDSLIYGKNNVGGIIGSTTTYVNYTQLNTLSKSYVYSSKENAGGIIGYYQGPQGYVGIYSNLVLGSTISAPTAAGGIVGYFDNSTTYSQNTIFRDNFVEGSTILSDEDTGVSGGLIGELYQTPQSEEQKFNKSLFYGTIKGKITSYGIGNVKNIVLSPIYGVENDAASISLKSNFKEYVNLSDVEEYQINSITDLNNLVKGTSFGIVAKDDNDDEYFPVFNWWIGDFYRRIKIPSNSDKTTTANFAMYGTSFLRNYAVASSNPVNIKFDVYASDVDKVNIEFSNIDLSTYFYYEIGDYRSNNIPIENRVYTIGYDYQKDLKIYVSNGSNYKYEKFSSNDLSKKISIINESPYYINNGILYSEDKSYTGGFVNLYKDKALTSDNKVYYINSQEFIDNYISYNIFESIPLYSFEYKGKNIKTYYKFTMIDNFIQNNQIIIKNGVLNIIDSSLNNKKDSYIIDYYNDKEIQIILKDDGKFYSLKNNISYPNTLSNNNIVELYTDISSQDTLAIIRYKNNGVYLFDYRTGDVLFTNVTTDKSLLNYIKDKLSNDSNKSSISSLSSNSNYKEMENLKIKVQEISIDDAKNKILGNNSSESNNKTYTTVYNYYTKKYDIYNIEDILTTDNNVETENEKIYKNYELVEFYNTANKKKSEKSLSGIVIFTLSILAILSALYLLIKRKQLRGES